MAVYPGPVSRETCIEFDGFRKNELFQEIIGKNSPDSVKYK